MSQLQQFNELRLSRGDYCSIRYLYKRDKKEKSKYLNGKGRIIHGGEFRGFIVYMKEICDYLKIQYQDYWSSMIIVIENEEYVVYQHHKPNAKYNWFYFSDKFKARNVKSFLRRTKRFLKEIYGDKAEEAFNKVEELLDYHFSDMVEEIKKEHPDVRVSEYVSRKHASIIIGYYSLLHIMYDIRDNRVSIRVNKKYFEKYRKKYEAFFKDFLDAISDLLKYNDLGNYPLRVVVNDEKRLINLCRY